METTQRHVTMTYRDREALKALARLQHGISADLLIAIVHWQRNCHVPFAEYVPQWAAARPDGEATELKQLYPLRGVRRIADNYSDWDSFGHPGYGKQTQPESTPG